MQMHHTRSAPEASGDDAPFLCPSTDGGELVSRWDMQQHPQANNTKLPASRLKWLRIVASMPYVGTRSLGYRSRLESAIDS